MNMILILSYAAFKNLYAEADKQGYYIDYKIDDNAYYHGYIKCSICHTFYKCIIEEAADIEDFEGNLKSTFTKIIGVENE